MVKASLKGSGLNPELPVEWCRSLVATAYQKKTEIERSIRKDVAASLRRLRSRSRKRGYEEGLQQIREEAKDTLNGLKELYNSSSEAAQADAQELAYRLAEELIEARFRDQPDSFAPIFLRAFKILQHSKRFRLSYNPKYARSV